MKTITIPIKYGEDWYERAPSLESGFDEGHGPGECEVIKRTKRHITLRLNDVALRDILSDADYYAETRGFDPEYYGLCFSAQAALKILRASSNQ